MKTTNFFKKDGNISSRKDTFTVGKSKISFTRYPGSNRGGMTIDNGAIITRLNSKGQVIGTGLRDARSISYFGKNFRQTSKLASF